MCPFLRCNFSGQLQKRPRLPLEDQLSKFYHKFGPSPRDAFTYAADLPTYQLTVEQKIAGMGQSVVERALTSGAISTLSPKFCYKVLRVSPHSDNRA